MLRHLSMGLFLSMCGLAAIGIMAGVCCLIFNIINKNRRYFAPISSKTCVKRPLSKDQKLVFKTNYHLMQVKNIAECSPYTVKPVLNGCSQKDHTLVFKANYHLMQVKNTAECSKGGAFCNTFDPY